MPELLCNQAGQQGLTVNGVNQLSTAQLLANPRIQADVAELMKQGPVKSIMVRECCRCHKYLGVKEGNGASGVTSGICLPCGIKSLPAHLHDDFRKQHSLEPVQIGQRGEVI